MTKFTLSTVLLVVSLACSVAALAGFIIEFFQTGKTHWLYAIAPLINAVCVAKLLSSQAVRHSADRKSA
jgi:hypothetical protein